MCQTLVIFHILMYFSQYPMQSTIYSPITEEWTSYNLPIVPATKMELGCKPSLGSTDIPLTTTLPTNTRTNISIWQAMSEKIKCWFGGRQSKSCSHGRKLWNLWRPGIMPAIRQVLNNWKLLHTGETNHQTSLRFRINTRGWACTKKKKKTI